MDCTSLTSISIPDSVTSIGEYAFSGCTSLVSISIPDSVTSIGEYAFSGCTSLISISIPDSVTYIGYGAFDCCTSLANISIPDSVTYIGGYAFSGCTSLTSISIPNSVTSIGDGAFDDCTSLANISIPDSVTYIDGSTFSYCTSLTRISIPNSVTSIGRNAFGYCTSLTGISIPDSITSIGNLAFHNCTALTSINIPDRVTYIGKEVFTGCYSLTNIYYSGTQKQWERISKDIGLTSKTTIHYNYNPTIDPDAGKYGDYWSYLTALYNKYLNYPKKIYGVEIPSETTNYYGVWKKSVALAEAYENYLDAVKAEAKRGASAKTSIAQLGSDLQKADKKSKYQYINFTGRNVSDKAEKAAYQALAEYLGNYINEIDMGKINLDDELYMIDAKLTQKILANLYHNNICKTYNGCKVTINASRFGAFTGQLTVKDGKNTYNAIICSKPEEVRDALNSMLEGMKNLVEEATQQAYKSLFHEIADITGVSEWWRIYLDDIVKDAVKTLRKQGFGNILTFMKKCSDGYDVIHDIVRIKDYNLTDVNQFESALSDAEGMYKKIKSLKYSDSAVDNFVIKSAISKINEAKSNLESELYRYLSNVSGEPYKTGFEKWFDDRVKDIKGALSWMGIHVNCPVDFEVYDGDGNLLGYVKDGEVYFEEDIYIETDGDMKTVYAPDYLDIDIRMQATDDGEFSYIVERFDENGEETDRVNYYDIPIEEGDEFAQKPFENSQTITGADGEIDASEVLSADEDAFVTIRTAPGIHGNGTGSGNYARGDAVELIAVPDSGYILDGWYVDDKLVCADSVYRFTATEDMTVEVKFLLGVEADNGFETEMPDYYSENFYAYVYKTYNGKRGISLTTFEDSPADEITVYLTSYDKNGNEIEQNIEYWAELDEYGRYLINIPSLSDAAEFTLADAYGEVILSGAALQNLPPEVSDSFKDSIFASDYDGQSITLEALEDGAFDAVTAYAARFDENGALAEVRSIAPAIDGDVYTYTAPEGYKLMLWNNMEPVIVPAVQITD